MEATLELAVCALCKKEHTLAENTSHRDIVLGMKGMQTICNSHPYTDLAKIVEADCE